MKTQKVMSCTVSSCAKLVNRLNSGTCFCCQSCIWEYRSVLVILFYNILTLPGAPIHFVCGQPVRDVALLILQKLKVFLQNVFDSGIKLIELYTAVENVLKVHIQLFCSIIHATSRNLFRSSVECTSTVVPGYLKSSRILVYVR